MADDYTRFLISILNLLDSDCRNIKQDSTMQELSKQNSTVQELSKQNSTVQELSLKKTIYFTLFHIGGLYGAYLALTQAKLATILWAYVLYIISMLGMQAGAHMLWCHRSYKAKWPLSLILIIFQTITLVKCVFHWARDHRLHHKYTETNADPYNAKRGLLYSQIGWLYYHRHPDVIEKSRLLDYSDLENDPFVAFQKKHYTWMMLIFSFILPILLSTYLWGENITCAFFVACILRQMLALNAAGLVNSVSHKYGSRPYDRSIYATDNKFMSIPTLGGGFHNYHHTFPWDYRSAEHIDYTLNLTAAFIDFFAKIGWAYDLKTTPADMINRRAKRTADSSHKIGYEKN